MILRTRTLIIIVQIRKLNPEVVKKSAQYLTIDEWEKDKGRIPTRGYFLPASE